jgi:membrane fusion protein (multidrug efflux system)
MTRRGKFITGTVLFTLLVGVVIIRATSTDSHTKARDVVKPVAVEVSPVTARAITETVSGIGTINAQRDVIVSSETAGRITKVYCKVGDPVREGQTLMQVDDELQAIAAEQARAGALAATTNFQKARKDYERSESLYTTHDISDSELEAYRLAFRSAEAQQKSAQAALKQAERALADTRIKSPIPGIVSRAFEIGETVTHGKAVANIVDLSSVKVKLSVSEDDITKLRNGQPVLLKVDSAPGHEFEGSVYSVGAKAEAPMGHTYPVEVSVKNTPDLLLKAGMFARVDITTNLVEHALTVSKESLVDEDSQPAVFIARDSAAYLQRVGLGIRSGNNVQITRGLHEGDLVVSFGQKQLTDGALVSYHQ